MFAFSFAGVLACFQGRTSSFSEYNAIPQTRNYTNAPCIEYYLHENCKFQPNVSRDSIHGEHLAYYTLEIYLKWCWFRKAIFHQNAQTITLEIYLKWCWFRKGIFHQNAQTITLEIYLKWCWFRKGIFHQNAQTIEA